MSERNKKFAEREYGYMILLILDNIVDAHNKKIRKNINELNEIIDRMIKDGNVTENVDKYVSDFKQHRLLTLFDTSSINLINRVKNDLLMINLTKEELDQMEVDLSKHVDLLIEYLDSLIRKAKTAENSNEKDKE